MIPDRVLAGAIANFLLPALTIAKIFKSRWMVELFSYLQTRQDLSIGQELQPLLVLEIEVSDTS
jgi:hypothetical protein